MTGLIRSLAAAVLAFGLAGVGYAGLIKPGFDTLDVRRIAVAGLQHDIARAEARLRLLEASDVSLELPPSLTWEGDSRQDAELSLQKAIVRLMDDYQLNPMTYGTTRIELDFAADTLGFAVEVEAPLPQFYRFLNALEQTEPQVAVQSLHIRPSQRPGDESPETMVSVRMTLWAYWTGPV